MSKTGTQSTAASTPATRPTTQPAAWRRIAASYRTEIAIAAAIIVLELVLGLFIPNALTMGNFSDIAQATAPLIIMAIGVLLVVITGGIDLSVGSVFSLAGMVTGLVMVSGYSSTVATICGLLVGVLFGAINGFLVTFAGLAPFVVTLITYAVAASLAFIVTNGHSLPINDPGYWLLNGGAIVPGLPNYALFCILLLVIVEFGLRRIVFGRWVYAVGSSPGAARLLGIPVHLGRFSVYVISGLLAAFASVLTVSYISNAEGTAGAAMMLQAIAAVVIGGASLFGGTGSAIGAFLGALMITVIQNGVNLIGINTFWQGSVTGLVILVAVLIDRIGKARR
jgi:ribose transport system permease protein